MKRTVFGLALLTSLASCSESNIQITEDLSSVIENNESKYQRLAFVLDSLETNSKYFELEAYAEELDSLGVKPTLGNLQSLIEQGKAVSETAEEDHAAYLESIGYRDSVKAAYEKLKSIVNSGELWSDVVTVSAGKLEVERYSYSYGIKNFNVSVRVKVQEAYKGKIKKVVFGVVATDDNESKAQAITNYRERFDYSDPDRFRADLYGSNSDYGTWELPYSYERRIGNAYRHFKVYATPLYVELVDGSLLTLEKLVAKEYNYVVGYLLENHLGDQFVPEYYNNERFQKYDYMQEAVYGAFYDEDLQSPRCFVSDEDAVAYQTYGRFIFYGIDSE